MGEWRRTGRTDNAPRHQRGSGLRGWWRQLNTMQSFVVVLAGLLVVTVVLVLALGIVRSSDATFVSGKKRATSSPTGSYNSASSAPRVVATSPGVKFTVRQEPVVPDDTTSASYSLARGTPYDVTSSDLSDRSMITFPVEAEDLAPIGNFHPTTTNLFIAIYEPGLHMWAPLPTTYDHATNTISASAPHFSQFAKRVVNGRLPITLKLGGVGTLVKDSAGGVAHVAWKHVTGVMALQGQFLKLIGDKLYTFANEPQKTADCSRADKTWKVLAAVQETKFPGCVSPESSGGVLLEFENHLAVPYVAKLPPGASSPTDYLKLDSLPEFIAHFYAAGLGGSYLAPHGVQQIAAEPSLAANTKWGVGLHLDWISFVVATALAALSVVPGGEWMVGKLSTETKTALVKVASESGTITLAQFSKKVTLELSKQKTIPGSLDMLGSVSDLVGCAGRLLDKSRDMGRAIGRLSLRDGAETATNVAMSCAATLIQRLSGEGIKSQVAEVLLGARDLSKQVISIVQAARLGPEINMFDVNVTHHVASDRSMWEATLKNYEGINCRQKGLGVQEQQDCVITGVQFSTVNPRYAVVFAAATGHEGGVYRRSTTTGSDFTLVKDLGGAPESCSSWDPLVPRAVTVELGVCLTNSQ